MNSSTNVLELPFSEKIAPSRLKPGNFSCVCFDINAFLLLVSCYGLAFMLEQRYLEQEHDNLRNPIQ